ncbi:MAG: hypothetical protein IPG04_36440 [Polyangiaceae bacterium]|nr:hypothetical protein [Polyangiaceae bacterium]
MTHSLLVPIFACAALVAACGDKTSTSTSGIAAASVSSAVAAKPKGKAGSVSVVIGDKSEEVALDSGFIERNSTRATVTLYGGCPGMTCDDSFKSFKEKCPKGKLIKVLFEDVKEGMEIPVGQRSKPNSWVRWMPDPDNQDDLWFDKGLEITRSDKAGIAGIFSITYDQPDPGGASNMTQKGGSLKGTFEATLCP